MELKIIKKLVMLARHDGVEQTKMAEHLKNKCSDVQILDQAINEVFSMPSADWEERRKTFMSILTPLSE